MKILIFGEQGFVGSSLYQKLSKETSHEIFVHPRHIPLTSGPLPHVDLVINCAGVLKDESRMIQDNLVFALDVAIECAINNKKLIHFASCLETTGRQGLYSKTKRAATDIILSIKDLNVNIVRSVTVYGPGEGQHSLLNKFWIGSQGEKISFPNDAREWIYIDDITDFFLTLLKYSNTISNGRILYASGRQRMTNENFLKLFTDITKQQINYELNLYNTIDCEQTPSNLDFDYHWIPKVSMIQGISNWIEWHKNLYGTTK